jgi:hypothetical protein
VTFFSTKPDNLWLKVSDCLVEAWPSGLFPETATDNLHQMEFVISVNREKQKEMLDKEKEDH